ncbi:MAG: CinA family protein [Lysobacterales bacterium]
MSATAVPADAELEILVGAVAERLLRKGLKLATAESCTGGWIAKCCTDRAGSSDWFERGFVTYSNAAKLDMLGVDAADLERDGAVSRTIAAQMAEGACRHSGADIALAVTGIAGPDGGSPEKPVGTVWFGWSRGGAPAQTERVRFDGGREAVRRQTVTHALQGLLARLSE